MISSKHFIKFGLSRQNRFTQYAYQIDTGEPFVVLDVGDFDGDGALDLLVATASTTKICLSPLAKPGALGLAGSMVTFKCDPTRPSVGLNSVQGLPYVVDVLGDGRSAMYSEINLLGNSTLCIQKTCLTDSNPPPLLQTKIGDDGVPTFTLNHYTALTQSVDFTGIGKPYDIRWSVPHYSKYIMGDAGVPMYSPYWENLQPTITMTGFNLPGATTNLGQMDAYTYTAYQQNKVTPNGTSPFIPYTFDAPTISSSLSADFNGSGYNSVVFGFLELDWSKGAPASYSRAETTLCIPTGRALDCGIRRKYSGANYQKILAVGNFVGDGQASVLVLPLKVDASLGPIPNGSMQMCRITGDDTTGGNGTADNNMVCSPWAGTYPNLANNSIFMLDLMGIGRPQMVVYHSGVANGSTWTEDGRWEVFVPVDVAVTGQALDRIYQVTNGLGATSTATYVDGLPSGVVSQTGTTNLQYPQHLTGITGKLVSNLSVSNGVSANRSVSYKYQDAAIDVAGRGSLGFAGVISTDDQTGIVTSTRFRQDWPYTGMALSSTTTAGSCNLSATQNTLGLNSYTWANGAVTVMPVVQTSTTQRSDLTCSDLGTTTTANTYSDNWGNLNAQTVTVTGGGKTFTTQTNNTYLNDSTHWWIGQLTQTVQTKTDPVSGSLTRTKALGYDPTYGLLANETIEPGSPQYQVLTSYDRTGNPFGLVNKTTQSWLDPLSNTTLSRTSGTTYDDHGRYPVITTNALGQQAVHSVDPATGAQLSLKDPNGLITSWSVNGFGRKLSELHPDGTNILSYLKTCQNDCPAGAVVAQITDTFNGANRVSVPHVAYSDSAGHVLRQLTWGFDGRAIDSDQRYDSIGRLFEVDQPRYDSDKAYLATRYTYDILNRVVKVLSNDATGQPVNTTTSYNGFVTTLVNANNQTRIDTRNVIGQVVNVRDAIGGNTQFGYEPFGNLALTTDPNGNQINVTYDRLGRKTDLRDPDLGWIHYDIDPLGQTWRQISPVQRAKQASNPSGVYSTVMAYDLLGRMVSRVEDDLKSYWTYDTATMGIGQLAEAYTGTAATKDYDRLHTYDNLGRPNTTTQKLTDGLYTTQNGYDTWGRLSTLTYQRNSDPAKSYAQIYNNFGYLAGIQRGSLMLWQATAQDASNRPRQIALGNGLVQQLNYNDYTGRLDTGLLAQSGSNLVRLQEGYRYDPLGNVLHRKQFWDNNGFDEDFTYDNLNRIFVSTVVGQPTQNFAYDAAGNILSKTEVSNGANYAYPAQGPGAQGPHAVQSIPGIGNFSYDLNGNMTAGASRNVTWNDFDMPVQISRTTAAGGTVSSSFVYGAEHQRLRQDRSDGSKIIYAGAQEVEVSAAGLSTVKTYWPHGIGVEIDRPGAATTELNWVHHDRLGSPVAITDQNGSLKEKLAYDAWGKRRSLDGSSIADSIVGVTDNKGFTGHEMLEALELVHMNGRVYDPLVGRFMSGDPLVQEPTNGQNYNRYSYVLNNPTNLTDPTGFTYQELMEFKFAKLIGQLQKAYDALTGNEKERVETGPQGAKLAALKASGAIKSSDGTTQTSAKQQAANSAAGTVNLANSAVNGTRNFIDGGYGEKGAAAFRDGNYGTASVFYAAGTAYATLNVFSLGTEGAIANGLAKVEKSIFQHVLEDGIGFSSFNKLKNEVTTEAGYHLHHIVEQTPSNLSKFGSEAIHNTANVVPVAADIHVGKGSISAYYSSKQPFTEGLTVRKWLAPQSFDAQYNFGMQVLKDYGLVK